MDKYYSPQAIMRHFTGHAIQSGSWFACVALPFAKRALLPAVQSIAKDLFVHNSPQILEIATKERSLKRAAETALKMAFKKQTRLGGCKKRKLSTKTESTDKSGRFLLQYIHNSIKVLLVEASHSLLVTFERPSFLITLDTSFEQMVGPLHFPN